MQIDKFEIFFEKIREKYFAHARQIEKSRDVIKSVFDTFENYRNENR